MDESHLAGSCQCCRQRLKHRKLSKLYTSYLIIGTAFCLVNVTAAIPSDALKKHLTTLRPPDNTEPTVTIIGDADVSSTNNNTSSTTEIAHPSYEKVCRANDQFGHRGHIRLGNTAESLLDIVNCTVIEGSLQIIWIYNKVTASNYTNIVLPNLREITGYLLLFRVNGLKTLGQIFPNLRVIRAEAVFYDFGLVIYEAEDLQSISLPQLRYLGHGVVAGNNPQLCFLNMMDWSGIIPKSVKPNVVAFRNSGYDTCSLVEGCSMACLNKREQSYCWDMDTCQEACKCPVSPGSKEQYDRGCAPDNTTCCHTQCMGGCTQPNSASHCYVCQGLVFNGTCYDQCPEFDSAGVTLYQYEGRRCVTEKQCFDLNEYNKLHNHQCMFECPLGYAAHPEDDHACVKCEGICEKECLGGIFENVHQTDDLHKCTFIWGNVEIILSKKSDVEDPERLKRNFQLIHTIQGYLKIYQSHYLTTLAFFRDLTTIKGETMERDRYSLIVQENRNLAAIWDFESHPQLTLERGKMFFVHNSVLCYDHIVKLVNITDYKGTYIDEDNKTVNVTAASHGRYDISQLFNGQRGDCFNNTLALTVFINPYMPNVLRFNFSSFETNNVLMVIGYQIKFRPLQSATEKVTYPSDQEVCDTEEESKWHVHEYSYTGKEHKKWHYVTIFDKVEAFTQYAIYVQAELMDSLITHGARSEIKYVKTPAGVPESPTITTVQPLQYEEDNIGLLVSWEPPEKPNGVLYQYRVYYRPIRWKVDLINRKDFCEDAFSSKGGVQVTEAPDMTTAVTTLVPDGFCPCLNKTTVKDKVEVDTENYGQRFQFTFQNFIHNVVIQKGKLTRRRRSVPEENLVTTPQTTTAAATDLEHTTTTPGSNSTESENGMNTTTAAENSDEDNARSEVVVLANVTSIPIPDLEPFVEYAIEIVACQAFNTETNKTYCSDRALENGRTARNASLDVISSSTFSAEAVLDEEQQKAIGVNLTWEPPAETNGPILTYKIKWSDAEVENASSVEVCVPNKEFMLNNNFYFWDFATAKKVPTLGRSYKLSVKVQTVGTEFGNYTNNNVTVYLKQYVPSAPPFPFAIVFGSSVTVGLIIVLLVILSCYFYRQKKPPVPLGPIHNSMNPDYIDTDNVYLPDEWELERTKVKIGATLGQGSFGMVYEGTATDLYNSDNKLRSVAIKTVNNSASLQERINFLNEASRMKSFECHHMVKLLGVVSQGSPVLVIMELMGHGDLRNYLRKHRPHEPDNDGRAPPKLKEILQMAAEIADGMAYLADKRFVHRDLAARNCMVSEDMTVKIGDFGMSRDVYYSEYYRKGGKAMLPIRWMAPESLRDGICTSKSDVWSYGIVLYEMATLAAQPYVGFTNEQVIPYVLEGNVMEMPSGCPTKLSDLMTGCWNYYPRARPSFNQIIETLQGDVKRSFFSVSWYYNHRDSDAHSQDSGSQSHDENDESQPLNAESITASYQNLNADHDLDSDGDDEMHDKALLVDMPGLYTYVPNSVPNGTSVASTCGVPESHINGNSFDSENDDSYSDRSVPSTQNVINNITESLPVKFKTGGPPPTYSAALDGSLNEMPVWATDSQQGTNSHNGSANGHIQYNNKLTSAC